MLFSCCRCFLRVLAVVCGVERAIILMAVSRAYMQVASSLAVLVQKLSNASLFFGHQPLNDGCVRCAWLSVSSVGCVVVVV